MERLTEKYWRNLDPWERCGQDRFCAHGRHDLGGCTNGCIVPKLYAHLGAYEDTGLEPEEVIQTKLALMGKVLAEIKEFEGIPADRMIELAQAEKDGRLVVLPPNSPLTLDELRGMDGEPVWVELIGLKRPSAWYLLNLRDKEAVNKRGGFVSLINYGDTWLAYRRRPEEGTK